jgi:hypothetical protein
MVFTSDFSGRRSVMSSNPGDSLCRVPGVTGFNLFIAMTDLS